MQLRRNNMKKRKILVLFVGICMMLFSISCSNDPYNEYNSTSIEVKQIPYSLIVADSMTSFGDERCMIFKNYTSYSEYEFSMEYPESFFEANDLLLFVTNCCSTDEMSFSEVLENNDILYPLFYRKNLKPGQPVTDDFIILAYYAEIEKSLNYEGGTILYRYK